MKKRIIAGLMVSAVLVSTMYANSKDYKHDNKKNFKKHHSMKKNMKENKQLSFFSVLKEVYLSKEQKESIKKIMQNSKKEKESIFDAFTSTSFDKEKYLSIIKAKKENTLELKANTIAKIYAVLDKRQKEELKKRFDEKKEKMLLRQNKRLNNDKDTNG